VWTPPSLAHTRKSLQEIRSCTRRPISMMSAALAQAVLASAATSPSRSKRTARNATRPCRVAAAKREAREATAPRLDNLGLVEVDHESSSRTTIEALHAQRADPNDPDERGGEK
jgi:hypothetical protein